MVEVTDTCLLNYGVNSPCTTRKSCSRQLTQEPWGVRCHLQLPVDKYIGMMHTKAFSANFHPVLFCANFSVYSKLAFVQLFIAWGSAVTVLSPASASTSRRRIPMRRSMELNLAKQIFWMVASQVAYRAFCKWCSLLLVSIVMLLTEPICRASPDHWKWSGIKARHFGHGHNGEGSWGKESNQTGLMFFS